VAYPSELLRHQVIAVTAFVGLVAAGAFALVHGIRTDADYSNAFIGFGLVSLLVGIPGAYLTTAWYRKAARLVSVGNPTPATAILVAERNSDSTTLYAELALNSKTARVAVLTPTWEYNSILGLTMPAEVFIDSRSALIKAVSTERGMLWCIPHNVALRERIAA
jgi:hypothetical protein